MTYFDEEELYKIITQSNFDKEVIKKILNHVYEIHKLEDQQAFYDE